MSFLFAVAVVLLVWFFFTILLAIDDCKVSKLSKNDKMEILNRKLIQYSLVEKNKNKEKFIIDEINRLKNE